jgi:formate/nitrite transporter FocA (FNT family)
MTGGPEIRRSPVIVGVAFLVHNLLPVTIGHVSGGALFVAAVYDLVY